MARPLEILDDDQPAANAMFACADHPALGPVTVLGPPVGLDRDGFRAEAPTPPFGSESRALLEWAGLGQADVRRLLAGGAVHVASGGSL